MEYKRNRPEAGTLSGRASQVSDTPATELTRLRREKAQLEGQLEQARLIIEVQKKLCQLFGLPT